MLVKTVRNWCKNRLVEQNRAQRHVNNLFSTKAQWQFNGERMILSTEDIGII